ncbi:MAG: SMUG2 DNA glycosylase family protein [Bacteroidales bacterium]|nr:SMUG2 DNA glycosylase family protein [Bacteroidales bacterium]
MLTFADKAILFFSHLKFEGSLPAGISIMNPFAENKDVMQTVSEFYRKYYSDSGTRRLIMGINPGRFGGGLTGIPFTDSVRLKEKCGLSIPGVKSYETSSVFIYEMIDSYGGPGKFYGDYYITSVSPLGFTSQSGKGRIINFNYYDNRELEASISGFAVDSLNKQLDFGIERDVCFCLGSGKNYRYLNRLNQEYHFFDHIEPLEHPRFIMQYRLKHKDDYVSEYIAKLNKYVKQTS